MSQSNESFSTSISVSQLPNVVFAAVLDPRAWWSQDIKGSTKIEGDEFEFEVKDVHYSKQRLIEVIPDERVVWLVTDANMTFIEDHDEWKNTKIVFDISRNGNETVLTFTHEGLVPAIACYKACMPAWTEYIKHSLKQLIETGIGDPNLEGRTIQSPVSLGNHSAMTNIAVKNIERARTFYENTLGLTKLREDSSGRTMYKTGSTALFLYESEFAGTNKADYVAWEVGADFQNIVKKLRDAGVTFEHYKMPGISIVDDIHVMGEKGVVWFQDADGNLLNIAGNINS